VYDEYFNIYIEYFQTKIEINLNYIMTNKFCQR